MDISEVPVSHDDNSKKKKKSKKRSVSEEGAGVVKKEVEEKMEKSEAAAAFPPSFSVSEIKNKQRRHLMFMKLKQEKRKVKASVDIYLICG